MSDEPVSDQPATGDPAGRAKARYFTIQAVRLTGTVLAILGILAMNGRFLPREAGYGLAAVGIVAALVAPTLLARRWRTRR